MSLALSPTEKEGGGKWVLVGPTGTSFIKTPLQVMGLVPSPSEEEGGRQVGAGGTYKTVESWLYR